MHAERFGKALGWGVRQAGKALFKAADAAASPSPTVRASSSQPRPATVPQRRSSARPGVAAVTVDAAGVRRGGVREGIGRFTSSVVRPMRRAGGVLWLEITGLLFGLFAAFAALGVWMGRAHLRPGPGQVHELAGVCMFLVFGWFAVSNFVRAARRARRP